MLSFISAQRMGNLVGLFLVPDYPILAARTKIYALSLPVCSATVTTILKPELSVLSSERLASASEIPLSSVSTLGIEKNVKGMKNNTVFFFIVAYHLDCLAFN